MACEGIVIETSPINEVIEVGVVGPQGPAGTAGVGVPTGGITGYVLAKASTADYDTEWVEQTGGGGDFASPPPIGNVTPNSGFFTTISASGIATLPHIHGSLAGNLYVHVKNTSGGTLAKGTPVYITGNVGGSDRVEVSAADFDDAAKMPAVGLLETELAQNGEGNAVIVGELTNVNTAAYTLNTELYIGNNGTLTATAPVLVNQIRQSVGIVSRVQTNTGIIVVNMQGELGTMPNAHASSHASSGSDPLELDDLGSANASSLNMAPLSDGSGGVAWASLTNDPEFANISTTPVGIFIGDQGWENIPADDNLQNVIGQINSNFAPVSHTHGNLTNDGKLGSTAGLPLVTTTAGAVTTLALGTANQVLRVNSGATGVEFADPAASGASLMQSIAVGFVLN